MFCSVRNASNTEVKCVSGLSRSLFSWRSSSYGTCVRCSSSTQLQVETAQKQIPAGHLILVFLIDLVDVAAGSLLLHLLDWVRLHKSDVDTRAREVLQSDSPAHHQSYWDVVRNTWALTSRTSERHHPCPYVCVCVCVCRWSVWSCRAVRMKPVRCCPDRRRCGPRAARCSNAWTACYRACPCLTYVHLSRTGYISPQNLKKLHDIREN